MSNTKQLEAFGSQNSLASEAVLVSGNSMLTTKTFFALLAFAFLSLVSCKHFGKQIKLREEDQIFHAGPVESGFGVIFFGLYKEDKYEFCDGNFMDPGCYTGGYSL